MLRKTFLCLSLTLIPLVHADDFSQWKAAHEQNFQAHLSSQQKQFRKMLEDDWAAFTGQQGEVRDPVPKPVDPPVLVKEDEPEPQLAPKPPEPQPPAPVVPSAGDTVLFIGHRLTPPSWSVSLPDSYRSEAALVDAYTALATSDYQATLSWLENNRKALSLGDWGLWQLIRMVTEGHAARADDATLMQWFLLVEMGRDVRLGYADQRVVLLTHVQQMLYGRSYYTLDGQKYYDLADAIEGGVSLHIHGEQSDADSFDLAFHQHPVTNPDYGQRELRHGDNQLTFEFDRELARYYGNYPIMDLKYYFAAPFSDSVLASLQTSWASLDDRYESDLDKLNALMQLIQFGLVYETDQEQFGREHYQLPEELLFNPAADCEDRSIFFTKAVRALFRMDTVGLLYPGHVAAAVALPGAGSRLTFAGRSYLVTDPTYIGSRAGDSMPKYQRASPEVITF